jgi:hypothetical protein
MKFKLISHEKDIFKCEVLEPLKIKGKIISCNKKQFDSWFVKIDENIYETKSELQGLFDLLKKRIYKLAGYYIKIKKTKIENVNFVEKINKIAKEFSLTPFHILTLFIYAKDDIIQDAIKIGVYFDEKIFPIPDDLKKINKKNSLKGGINE